MTATRKTLTEELSAANEQLAIEQKRNQDQTEQIAALEGAAAAASDDRVAAAEQAQQTAEETLATAVAELDAHRQHSETIVAEHSAAIAAITAERDTVVAEFDVYKTGVEADAQAAAESAAAADAVRAQELADAKTEAEAARRRLADPSIIDAGSQGRDEPVADGSVEGSDGQATDLWGQYVWLSQTDPQAAARFFAKNSEQIMAEDIARRK